MYLDVYRAIPEAVMASCGISWSEDGGALRLSCSRENHPFFNRIMGLPGDDRNLGDWTDEVIDHYRELGIARWMVQVAPGELSPELVEVFRSHGLVSLRGWAKHGAPIAEAVSPAAAAECDLRIERIGSEWADAWAAVLGSAFGYPEDAHAWPAATVGRPGWMHYGAFDGNELVGTAALFVADKVGSLNYASTRPSHRRRGVQSALIARRIEDARQIGLEWLVTETDEERPERPNPSYHNIVRAGLVVRYVRTNWGPPPPA
jgi:GNAT superfamily N-acetyltransferase